MMILLGESQGKNVTIGMMHLEASLSGFFLTKNGVGAHAEHTLREHKQ